MEERERFAQAVASGRGVVVKAPMGSGKTTLVPQWLVTLDVGRGLVVVPRRILAIRAAERVAPNMSSLVGERVGYIIRSDHRAHPRTEATFVTEGIFKLLLQHKVLLPGFGWVIFDEAHEQGAWSTVYQGIIKSLVRPRRPGFIPGVMSGTLDEALYTAYWDAPLVSSTGREYPLEIRHEPDMTVRQAVESIIKGRRTPATILVFQPGYAELRECVAEPRRAFPRVEVLELHGAQELADQQLAFESASGWRIVVATNIAESGVTIAGVHYVVDTGTEQLPVFDQELGVERLDTVEISQQSAGQRAHRAGRLPPDGGDKDLAIRLWSIDNHKKRRVERIPEIQRCDLSPHVLWLRSMGISLRELDLLYVPPEAHILAAEETLRRLGAFDGDAVTNLGHAMLRLPVDEVRLAKAVLLASASSDPDSLESVLDITALQGTGRSLFVRARDDHERKEARVAHAALRSPEDHSDLSFHLRAFERLKQLEFSGRLHQEARTLYLSPRAYLDAFALREQLDWALRESGVQWNGTSTFSPDSFVRVGLPALLGQLIVKDGRGRWRLAGPRPIRVILSEESAVDRPETRLALAQLRGLAPASCAGAGDSEKVRRSSALLATSITVFEPELLLEILPGAGVERTRFRYDRRDDAVLCDESWFFPDGLGQYLFLFTRTARAPQCEEALWRFAQALAAEQACPPGTEASRVLIARARRLARERNLRLPGQWRERLALWYMRALREQGSPMSVRQMETITLEITWGEILSLLESARLEQYALQREASGSREPTRHEGDGARGRSRPPRNPEEERRPRRAIRPTAAGRVRAQEQHDAPVAEQRGSQEQSSRRAGVSGARKQRRGSSAAPRQQARPLQAKA